MRRRSNSVIRNRGTGTLSKYAASATSLIKRRVARRYQPFASIAKTPGLTNAALIVMLQSSHQTMPQIVIKGQDMSNIVAYILSLKESD